MKKLIFFFTLLNIVKNNEIIGYCDIKGSVVNPGVYEIRKNDTISNIVNKAGGLKKDSYTNNINLSKIVNDEMVIYINSKYEVDKINELNNCECEPIVNYIQCEKTTTSTKITKAITEQVITTKLPETTTKITTTKLPEMTTKIITEKIDTTTKVNDNKININKASLEELIKLNGLGESKAKNIIEYRNNNGLFKTIEDLLNVTGIGTKTFESIKDNIEV